MAVQAFIFIDISTAGQMHDLLCCRLTSVSWNRLKQIARRALNYHTQGHAVTDGCADTMLLQLWRHDGSLSLGPMPRLADAQAHAQTASDLYLSHTMQPESQDMAFGSPPVVVLAEGPTG